MQRNPLVTEARRAERVAAMAEVKRRERLEIFPSPCPTCFAKPGEECITRTGLRVGGRHKTRYNPKV